MGTISAVRVKKAGLIETNKVKDSNGVSNTGGPNGNGNSYISPMSVIFTRILGIPTLLFVTIKNVLAVIVYKKGDVPRPHNFRYGLWSVTTIKASSFSISIPRRLIRSLKTGIYVNKSRNLVA